MAIACAMLFSCGQNASQQAGGNQDNGAAKVSEQTSDKSDDKLVMQFLDEIYHPKDYNSDVFFQDEWILKHCSQKMQKKLRDEYEYDGEGWASWIIGGWGAGEDCPTKVTSITNEGNKYFIEMVPTDYCLEFEKGKRTICLTINLENNIPVIDECVWTTDFEKIK